MALKGIPAGSPLCALQYPLARPTPLTLGSHTEKGVSQRDSQSTEHRQMCEVTGEVPAVHLGGREGAIKLQLRATAPARYPLREAELRLVAQTERGKCSGTGLPATILGSKSHSYTAPPPSQGQQRPYSASSSWSKEDQGSGRYWWWWVGGEQCCKL